MRKDQFDRINDLSESIGEVFIEEADPGNWSGAGIPLKKLDEQERGNRYWDKKNAIQTGTLLARVLDLRDRGLLPNGGPPMPDVDAEKEIKRYEKQARELIDAIQSGSTGKR